MHFIRFRKLYNSETLKFRIELVIGYVSIPLSGFWFNMI